MKYSKHDYESVIAAFDRTIKRAKASREAILFNCLDIPSIATENGLHDCPKYCPFYGECHDAFKAEIKCDSAEWQKKKTEFVRTARRYFDV